MSSTVSNELKSHPIFGVLDQFSLERLMLAGSAQPMRRNEVVCAAGERLEHAMLILDGTVKVTAPAPNRREVILDVLGSGDLVGEECVVDERPAYGASVMRDAIVVAIPANVIRSLLARNADFALAWIKYGAASKQRLQQRVTELAYGNIEDRLFRILYHLSKQHGTRTSKGNTILRFPLTHQEIANLIGATRETTTVAVGRLKLAGVIGVRERKIILKDKIRVESPQEERAG